MKFRLWFSGLVLLGLILVLSFNNCGRVAFKEDRARKDGKSETDELIVGNPNRHAAKSLLVKVCETMTRCHSGLSQSQCEAGVSSVSGIDYQLGLSKASYASFGAIMAAEEAGSLVPSPAATNSCLTAVEELSCSDANVLGAYAPSAGAPFAGVAFLIPTYVGSCPSVFNQPETRKDYYVATNGSDTNDGTAERPWATITHAASALTLGPEGATVHVASGVYAPAAMPSCSLKGNSCGVRTARSGTAAAPIVFVSDHQWGAKIAPVGAYSGWYNSGDHVSIIGFEVVGDSASNMGIQNEGSNVRVISNHVHNVPVTQSCADANGGGGITHTNVASRDNESSGNRVHDIGPVPGNGMPAGSYCNFAHGIIHDHPGVKIQNNVLYRAAAWGVASWGAAARFQVTNNLIFNCGWQDNTGNFWGGGIALSAASGSPLHDGSTVANNIIRNNTGYGVYASSSGNGNVYLNNMLYSNIQNFQFNNTTPNTSSTIVADPLMIDFRADGTGNYRLQAGSPAINAGTSSCAVGAVACAPTHDLTGFARPYGGALDIGPYEWHP